MNLLMKQMKMKTTHNTQEVGGNHYQMNGDIEPVHLMVEFNLNWFQGEIIKYTSRHWNKHGAEDLSKALHICDMAGDFDLNKVVDIKLSPKRVALITKYCNQYKGYFINKPEASINFQKAILLTIKGFYRQAQMDISQLKLLFYGEE